MPEETIKVPVKKKKGWFQKIPSDIILSPKGILLGSIALLIEVIDIFPLPGVEIVLDLIFVILFIILVREVSWKALVFPFLFERIPVLSSICPTFILKFMGLF